MSNTLEALKEHITPELLSEAAKIYDENEIGIYKAISSLGPTILAGLLEKSGDSHSIDFLFDSLRDYDTALLDNPERLLDPGNLLLHDPKHVSRRFLDTIFGAKAPAISHAVASFSGVKPSTVSSLSGLTGSMVMGLLSKKIKAEQLSAFSLIRYLLSQRDSIVSLLPAGVGSLLGMANIGYSNHFDDAKSGNGMRWLWPLLLVLGLGIALLCYLKC